MMHFRHANRREIGHHRRLGMECGAPIGADLHGSRPAPATVAVLVQSVGVRTRGRHWGWRRSTESSPTSVRVSPRCNGCGARRRFECWALRRSRAGPLDTTGPIIAAENASIRLMSLGLLFCGVRAAQWCILIALTRWRCGVRWWDVSFRSLMDNVLPRRGVVLRYGCSSVAGVPLIDAQSTLCRMCIAGPRSTTRPASRR